MSNVENITIKDVARIKLKETLKAGENVWGKGTVFDRKDGLFPKAVLDESKAFLRGESTAIEVLMTHKDIEAESQRLHEAEVARQEAVAAREAAEKELADRNEFLSGLEDSYKILESDRDDYKKKAEAFETEITNLESKVKKLEAANADLESEIKDLKKKSK